MKQIDAYINSVYHGVEETKEVKELKEEMRQHLLDAVEGLKAEGKTEEESVYIAIGRFGEIPHLSTNIQMVFDDQKRFTK